MQLLCKSKTNSILFCSALYKKGFPDSSVGKEPTCNAGDPGSIPGSGRSSGEGTGYRLQYSWASLVAQLVKNLPVKREIPGLGRSPRELKGYPIQYSGLENSVDSLEGPDPTGLDSSKSRQKSSLWKKGGLSVSFNRLQPMSSRRGDQEKKI